MSSTLASPREPSIMISESTLSGLTLGAHRTKQHSEEDFWKLAECTKKDDVGLTAQIIKLERDLAEKKSIAQREISHLKNLLHRASDAKNKDENGLVLSRT